MRKKKLLVGSLLLVIITTAVVAWFIFKKKSSPPLLSPLSQLDQDQKEAGVKLLTWDDQAGFTFEYPDYLFIDPHEEDMENYAHLEITSTKHPEGKIIIWVNDAPKETIDEWLKTYKEATLASVFDTSLAETSAKKLLFNDPQKIVTAAIDDWEGLFLLEGYLGRDNFWQDVYNQIISSFAFKPLDEEPKEQAEFGGGEQEAGGNVIYEEEEVIE